LADILLASLPTESRTPKRAAHQDKDYQPVNISQQVTRIAERLARHPWRVLGIALVLSIIALWATVQLPIYTSRQALLPKDTEVTRRFDAFLKDFGAASDLIIVLEGAPRGELEQYAGELAARLRAEPEIGLATDRLDLGFFLEHAYLLMPTASLDQIGSILGKPAKPAPKGLQLETALEQGLAWVKGHPPLGDMGFTIDNAAQTLGVADFFLGEWQRWLSAEPPPDGLDWDRLLARLGAKGMGNGYFTSRDGRMLFLFVHPNDPSEDFKTLGPFVDKVKAVAATLAEQTQVAGRTPPTVGLTGLPGIEYEEFINIRKDIKLVIFTSAALIATLILLVVRSVRWAVLIFIPMGLGVLWSLGLALITVGHLTVITAAFVAILFGLGADYGIFTSSRIAEERRAGKPLQESIAAGIGSSFTAILTAGGASVLIFGALATVDFPGFAELGVVAAKGVLMILLSTWLVQPALYALLPPKLRDNPAVPDQDPAIRPGKGQGAYPKSVAVTLVALALGIAGLGAMKGLRIPFDYDVLAMLPKDSQAAYYQRRMVAESDYQAEVVIFTAKTLAEARRIADAAGKLKTVAQVQSLTQFFPVDADVRLQQAIKLGQAVAQSDDLRRVENLSHRGITPNSFESIQSLLTSSLDLLDDAQEQAFSSGHASLVQDIETVRGRIAALLASIAQDKERGRVRSELFFRALLSYADSGLKLIASWQQAQPLTPQQLPPVLRDRFFAKDGSSAVYAFPAKTVYDPDNLDQLMQEVYSVSPDATGFPTTHQAFSKSVVESFSQGTVLALIVCLSWIALVLRSVSGFALASLPLLIGGGWMLGLMSLTGIQYNYANIIALPLVIALAVDYGVWFSYRWRELPTHTPLQVSLISGKVIGLAASTELAGLGAITLASYRGVSTMGVSITIGLLCCLTATLFVAPAIGQLLDPKRKQ
jgi:predicted RND superfamily exporter protein